MIGDTPLAPETVFAAAQKYPHLALAMRGLSDKPYLAARVAYLLDDTAAVQLELELTREAKRLAVRWDLSKVRCGCCGAKMGAGPYCKRLAAMVVQEFVAPKRLGSNDRRAQWYGCARSTWYAAGHQLRYEEIWRVAYGWLTDAYWHVRRAQVAA